MLYKFKSQAAAEVIMLQPDAETLLKIIGKSVGAQGIITAEQIPAAVAALRTAIEQQKAAAAQANTQEQNDVSPESNISLDRRATPFIDLLECSAAEGKDVVWGV